MAFKNDSALPRCPKCNEPMAAVEDRPRFAQFLPMDTSDVIGARSLYRTAMMMTSKPQRL
jgi:hypothetical protein